jgi:3-methyladenine DNA glycosylase AlkC
MRDGLDAAALARIARGVRAAWPAFPRDRFLRLAGAGLDALELKPRVRHILAALRDTLPASFPEQADILERLPAGWDPGEPGDPLRGFAAWPVIDLVAETGLGQPARALEVLRRLTGLFTAEFAIRPFLQHHWEVCRPRLERWTEDPEAPVRRLVSEGTRPRLPWGLRLTAFVRDPSPCLPLLERLRDDPSDSVRRSVANHLNDIAKDHPDRVVALCARWAENAPEPRAGIIRRATRTLVKAGHPGALALHGAARAPEIRVEDFSVGRKRVAIGESQTLRLALASTARAAQRLVVDFAVHFHKADGSLRPKVFKWLVSDLAPGACLGREKTVAFRPLTTRRLHPGPHRVDLRVNGRVLAEAAFALTPPAGPG